MSDVVHHADCFDENIPITFTALAISAKSNDRSTYVVVVTTMETLFVEVAVINGY